MVDRSTRMPIWSPNLIVAALAAGLAAFTKDEGISYEAIDVVALVGALIGWRLGCRFSSQSARSDAVQSIGWRPMATAMATLVVVPGLLLAPWLRHRMQLPLTGEMNYFGRLSLTAVVSGMGTLNWSIPHLAHRMFIEASSWGLQWWLLVLTLVLFPGRALRPAQLFLLLHLMGALSALLLAGMVAPVILHEHIGGSSHRYLMQIAPAALLFSLGQLSASKAGVKKN